MAKRIKKQKPITPWLWAYLRARDGCVGATKVCRPPPLFLDMPLDVAELPANAIGRASPSITYRRYVCTSDVEDFPPDSLTIMYDEQRPGRPAVINDLKPSKPLTVKKRLKLLQHFSFLLDEPGDLEYLQKQIRREYRK